MMFLRPRQAPYSVGQALIDLLGGGALCWGVRGSEMRQRWTGKAVVPKRRQSACPRCGAWSSAERCPQCGAHRLSTEFSQVRTEDRSRTATAGR